MEPLLAGIYISFCWVIFRIFRIPVNQWSLATATLGGIIGIVLLLLVMTYNHPFTTQARIYSTVTPILSGVRGRVVEVPVTPNAPLKEGDVLLKLDSRPYQYVVDQRKAQLAEAEQNVLQLKAALDQETAERQRMSAQYRLAQENYDRQQQLFDADVISKATLDTFARNLETARESVAAATASEERAREVISVLDAIAAGQILPSGGVQDFRAGEGRAIARIKLTSDISEYQIPLGSAAQVAILTHYFHHIALLRRTLLRMKSWQNYVFMEPHGGGGIGH